MPQFCLRFGAFNIFYWPILLLISMEFFTLATAIHPLKVRHDEQQQSEQQKSTTLANEQLSAELSNLEKQIEKINSTIFTFLAQQQQQSNDGKSQSQNPSNTQQTLELDRARLNRLTMERELLMKMMEQTTNGTGVRENNETTGPEIKKANSSTSMVSDASRLLCQFFVFGILFGVVCSISACSCLFRSRRNVVGSSSRAQSVEEANFNRLSQIREPFAPDKPYCLKFDERGLCYASPLTREVPPLPNYEQACQMPTAAEIAAVGHNKAAAMASATTTMINLQRTVTMRKALESIDALRV